MHLFLWYNPRDFSIFRIRLKMICIWFYLFQEIWGLVQILDFFEKMESKLNNRMIVINECISNWGFASTMQSFNSSCKNEYRHERSAMTMKDELWAENALTYYSYSDTDVLRSHNKFKRLDGHGKRGQTFVSNVKPTGNSTTHSS